VALAREEEEEEEEEEEWMCKMSSRKIVTWDKQT
jgi:hypothetical protein